MERKLSQQYISIMNQWGKERKPFLFFIDYEMKKPLIYALDELPDNVFFDFADQQCMGLAQENTFVFEKYPIPYEVYKRAWDQVMHEINLGNSFLLNLTFPNKIVTDLSLSEIYGLSSAKYKFMFQDEWASFSPETFVKIVNGQIYAHPMKGTIDASLPGASQLIMNNTKEIAEHNTIVDLIRNDLSRVAKRVRVSQFRYLDKINTHDGSILQVSSEIRGDLPIDFHENLGSLFQKLLPAGSISGAPKPKTMEIIRSAEGQERGYYTGIAGIYDGVNLDSCVLIRFFEKTETGMRYRSGGGITHLSNCQEEYLEMINKIYVPLRRNHKNSEGSSIQHNLSQSTVLEN